MQQRKEKKIYIYYIIRAHARTKKILKTTFFTEKTVRFLKKRKRRAAKKNPFRSSCIGI